MGVDDYFDFDDKGDVQRYDERYMAKIKELSKDADEADEVFDEMLKLNGVRHSNSPENDAELNWLKSRNEFNKKSRFDSATESLLRYQAQESGKSLAQVKREARKALKGGK